MPDRRQTAHRRGYDHRWRLARESFLKAHPLCVYCAQLGRVTPATVVDHVVPHRGDRALFWDRDNWQGLCAPCHDSVKAREERTGVTVGCLPTGDPIAPGSHWR